MKDRVYTTGEVAQICGVSPDTVARWFDLEQIGGYRLGTGGDRRIPYEDLRSFMLSNNIPLDRLEEDSKSILVVDDDPYYLDVITAFLSCDDQYTVLSASTGFDAGALVVEHNPQLVILDIHLTDMDGRMVGERIKQRQETQHTRILGISGFIDAEEERELHRYGFDDFLKKPFHIDELAQRVEALFHNTL